MVSRNSEKSVSKQSNKNTLPDFQTLQEAVSYFNANEGVVDIADFLGDGFTLIRDKEQLVNIPFLILDWNWINDPATARTYASVRVITSDNRRLRFNDGSTGIARQLENLETQGIKTGVRVSGGIAKSEYLIDRETRKVVTQDYAENNDIVTERAVTYFLASS